MRAEPRLSMVCADHRLTIDVVDGVMTCPVGHKVQRYRRLNRDTGALGPVTRNVDPASEEGKGIAMEIERRTAGRSRLAVDAKIEVHERAEPKAMAITRPQQSPAEDPRPRCRSCEKVLQSIEVQIGRGLCGPCAEKAAVPVVAPPRKALEIARAGIYTDVDLAELVQAVMLETLDGDLEPATANAVLSGAGKLLRVAEARARRGSLPTYDNGALVLVGRRPGNGE